MGRAGHTLTYIFFSFIFYLYIFLFFSFNEKILIFWNKNNHE